MPMPVVAPGVFEQYLPLLILVLVAALICAVMVSLSWVLGPKKTTPYKVASYECGVQPVGTGQERFPIKFYLVAILFVLFDIEVIFLWSWLTVFNSPSLEPAVRLPYQLFTGAIVGIYLLLWIIGDAYALELGAIDWDEKYAQRAEDTQRPRLEVA